MPWLPVWPMLPRSSKRAQRVRVTSERQSSNDDLGGPSLCRWLSTRAISAQSEESCSLSQIVMRGVYGRAAIATHEDSGIPGR